MGRQVKLVFASLTRQLRVSTGVWTHDMHSRGKVNGFTLYELLHADHWAITAAARTFAALQTRRQVPARPSPRRLHPRRHRKTWHVSLLQYTAISTAAGVVAAHSPVDPCTRVRGSPVVALIYQPFFLFSSTTFANAQHSKFSRRYPSMLSAATILQTAFNNSPHWLAASN